MPITTHENYNYFIGGVIALAMTAVLMPSGVLAKSYSMETWSDATVCRLIWEKHALVNATQFESEADKRGLDCLDRQVFYKDEMNLESLEQQLDTATDTELTESSSFYISNDSTESSTKAKTKTKTKTKTHAVDAEESRQQLEITGPQGMTWLEAVLDKYFNAWRAIIRFFRDSD